jgi:aminopeptidase N
MPKGVSRLFDQFQPQNYDLLLEVDSLTLTFKGTVVIRGKKVGRPSSRLTFHQKDLNITAASILKHGKKAAEAIPLSRINQQKTFDEVRLHTASLLYPGDYSITLEFNGVATKAMHGIYPCFYKHEDTDKRLIATQFESHHAREAFPCIDEPEAKATIDLSLITPLKETVLANTPIKKQEIRNKKLFTSFETTPVMSVYLLAFVYGELHCVTGDTRDGVKVSSWSTIAQPKDHLRYANEEAIKALEFFIDYFQTPFPLPKIDQVALPDFEALAMENWGLITFREVGLLADPKNRSLSGEQLITLVVAHELSHQWFGDLVTMKWWDDLWLNESFASIMENIAPDQMHPDWHQWEEFATSRVISCSHRDIYKDVQSVGVDVHHPDDISTLFDPAIVYAKGARLISMLFEFVGEDNFRSGLEHYFKKHEYANSTRHDLWEALGSVSHANIDKLMTPWISQPGQPLLRVKRDGNKLKLSQKRFLMDGDDTTSIWPIPLLTDQDLKLKMLDKQQAEIEYAGANTPIFNINGSGHYIVSYEDQNARDYVIEQVKSQSVSSISRITIMNDMFLLSRANEFKLEDLLKLIEKCPQEPRDAVWTMFMRIVGQAQTLTDGDEQVEVSIKRYKQSLAKYWYDKLGWDDKHDDNPNTKHLRSTALSLSLAGENTDAISKALQLFSSAKNVEALPAEQRAMLITTAVRHGKPEAIEKLMKEYVESPSPDVQQSIASALCSTKNNDVAKQIIKWGLSKNGVVRQQDYDHWFAYLMRNHYTRELAWEWFTSSWDRLIDMFSGGKHMEYFIWYSAGPLSTREWQSKFESFFKPKINIPGLKRNINIAFSEIDSRCEWRSRAENSLIDYFNSTSF